MGYYLAGFDVTGIDIEPQRHYPFHFIQAEALAYLEAHGSEYDAIHASPPCQFASALRDLPWLKDKEYPALIEPTRQLLLKLGKPYMLENVAGARWGSKRLAKRGLEIHGMKASFLCGTMFGRPFYRHRLFESSIFWLMPEHPRHRFRIREGSNLGGRARDIVFRPAEQGGLLRQPKTEWGLPRILSHLNDGSAAGCRHQTGKEKVAEAMQIDWMNSDELSQAIPPCYTEYLGKYLMQAVEARQPYEEVR